MTKKIFVLIAFLLAWASTEAQLKAGIKAGMNLNRQKISYVFRSPAYDPTSSSNTFKGKSFHAGFYLVYDLSRVVTLQPELLFNSIKVEVPGIDGGLEDFSFHYLSMPVMVGYGIAKNKLIFQGGLQPGYLMIIHPGWIKEYYKSFDLSLVCGAMYHLVRLNLSVRYSAGVIDIASNAQDQTYFDFAGNPIEITTNMKNNNLQFAIGYRVFGE